jgi:hypothetical protein
MALVTGAFAVCQNGSGRSRELGFRNGSPSFSFDDDFGDGLRTGSDLNIKHSTFTAGRSTRSPTVPGIARAVARAIRRAHPCLRAHAQLLSSAHGNAGGQKEKGSRPILRRPAFGRSAQRGNGALPRSRSKNCVTTARERQSLNSSMAKGGSRIDRMIHVAARTEAHSGARVCDRSSSGLHAVSQKLHLARTTNRT